MTIWTALILGLLIGWIIEWVIDWIYWRQRTQSSSAELENLRSQNSRLRADMNVGTESVNKLKADLATATSSMTAANAERDRLHAELDTLRAQGTGDQFKTQLLSTDPTLADAHSDIHLSDTGDQQNNAEFERLRADLADANSEIERLRAQLESPERTIAVGQRMRDPLIDINGIGPVYEQRLFDAGIYTFADLAAQSPARLRELVGAKSWQETETEAWVAEAQQLIQAGRGRSAQ